MTSLSQKKKTVLIMAGGTGGHVFPGLALAEVMKQRGYQVEWLGTEAGIESKLVPAANIPLHTIGVRGVRGRGVKALIEAPFNIIRAVSSARKTIKKIKPSVIVGLGGFVAGPGGVAAKLCGIPLVIHEQNAVAGTTNRLLARFANAVISGFPDVLPKTQHLGNPVRADFFANSTSGNSVLVKPERLQEGEIKILVFGGSRGAVAINALLPDVVVLLKNAGCVFKLRHQTGEFGYDASLAQYRDLGITVDSENVCVTPFIDNMSEALRWADLVICRSGALTVAELSAVGVASILVPFPFAIDDHQTANARYLADDGAAILRQQNELNAEELSNTIVQLWQQPERVERMALAAKEKAKPLATERFADICESLLARQACS
ncbi:undecaprenyldiphospho-muramoylpentapeptide beta-N-acetylglucosaminyltransferase [Teredinibacter waterburyi]|uniref:undecaprenyldiphospho-muramoylpentapeptide beta-N-acetylglucosaminyltransferase n=1 Tax=Teredinibacter waterburyi TaxID=1500538 RepID=UPI00165F80A6|nr:undecaprenyldiphospho-muramoylpentapeptide beta-N-acetylglucosaminyltransferase [Teredinibacter waterburyi]